MNLFVSGGAVIAALFSVAPAISQTPSSASLTSPTPHARHSSFTANQNRSDVATHIDRMFKKLDLNHDGFISKDEVAASLSQFDQRAATSAPKRASKMFDRLDTNHDGQVTLAEAEAGRAARKTATGKQKNRAPSSLFAKADANKDGIVTRAEFDAATATGKIRIRRASMRGSAIVRHFDAADLNKDGRLSLQEAQAAALQQFDAADVNHDGVLSPNERRQANKAERAKRRAV
jgi:Ca2+-binding EF-hand superfamily protein